ncbi:MAG: hypothetical protein ACRC3G_02455 [Bacteroidales bacterium]
MEFNIEVTRISAYRGDETADFKVSLCKELSVKEFIAEVLKRGDEQGEIVLNGKFLCSFYKGRMSSRIYGGWAVQKRKVVSATSYGGWTLMKYFLTV